MKTRRYVLGGLGVGAAVTAVGAAYRAAPMFWQQAMKEMKRDVLAATRHPDAKNWPNRGLHLAWLGHSTVLVKMDGFTFITDPILGNKAGIHLGPFTLGLKRLVAPAIPVDQLPPVDLILLSHAHMDHFDTATLRRLEDRARTVVTASETADLLRVKHYGAVHELRWNEEIQVGPVRVKALEVNHWGARMRSDTYRGYNGYLIESDHHRVLFAGDTALTDSFARSRTMRGVDAAIMPIGAYNPWIRVHCSPEQAWRMGNDARAGLLVPVHHQTFTLSREPLMEPIERFVACAHGDDGRVPLRQIGQELHI